MGFWRDLQGFYLVVGDTVSQKSGDFYLASQKTEGGRGKQRESDGFALLNGAKMRLKDAEVMVEKSDLTLGLYRWPRRWSGQWPANGAKPEKDEDKIRFRFDQISRRAFGNWVIGGFAMSLIRGEVSYRGRTLPVYGFGEFIK